MAWCGMVWCGVLSACERVSVLYVRYVPQAPTNGIDVPAVAQGVVPRYGGWLRFLSLTGFFNHGDHRCHYMLL